MEAAIELARLTGVVLRREAIELGADDRDLRRAVRAGVLIRIRQGAYTVPELWAEAFPEERHRIRCEAVRRSVNGDIAFTHASALVLMGIDVWDVDLDQVHVTRLDGGIGRREHGVVHHVGRFDTDAAVQVGDYILSGPAAAVIENTTLTGVEGGLVSADSALHQGFVTEEQLWRNFDERIQWPNSRSARMVLTLADGLSESVGETRFRHLCWRAGLPKPELQVKIYAPDGTHFATCDFGWRDRRALGEFDGRIKYGRLLKPGQRVEDVITAEKDREDKVREYTDCIVMRFTWPDLGRPNSTAERLRRKLGHTGNFSRDLDAS